ncbi:MAG: hypothetical protein OXN97_12675 [Bryobacterales bacterium]|nr:hypothetical protein [Bryobacterales bacterium]
MEFAAHADLGRIHVYGIERHSGELVQQPDGATSPSEAEHQT